MTVTFVAPAGERGAVMQFWYGLFVGGHTTVISEDAGKLAQAYPNAKIQGYAWEKVELEAEDGLVDVGGKGTLRVDVTVTVPQSGLTASFLAALKMVDDFEIPDAEQGAVLAQLFRSTVLKAWVSAGCPGHWQPKESLYGKLGTLIVDSSDLWRDTGG